MNRKTSVSSAIALFMLITACFIGAIIISYKNNNLSQEIFAVQSSSDVFDDMNMQPTAQQSTTEATTTTTAPTTTTTAPAIDETKGKYAYLTFDDGPSENTSKILDILDQYNIKATFFVIYKKNMDSSYKEIVDRGHAIGLHAYSHTYKKIYKSEDAYFADLEKISAHVEKTTGVKSKITRFPGGSSNTVSNKYSKGIMKKLVNSVTEKGYVYHDWNVNSGDADAVSVPADELVANIQKTVDKYTDNRSIDVLMHDTGKSKITTVEALPQIIEYLQSKGYTFMPITENTPPVQHRKPTI